MIEYLIIIALVEFMVYMALRIVHAFAFFIEEPSNEIEAREMSQEEFETLMRDVFGGEKDD